MAVQAAVNEEIVRICFSLSGALSLWRVYYDDDVGDVEKGVSRGGFLPANTPGRIALKGRSGVVLCAEGGEEAKEEAEKEAPL